MKLIRLTTQDQKCYFDNSFDEDIIVEPNSKIALQSLTTQMATDELVIDAQNSLIQYSANGNALNAEKDIHMAHGTYDKSNINTLFDSLTTSFNKSMEQTESQIGRQWRIGTINNKVTFQMKTGEILNPSVSTKNIELEKVQSQTVNGNTFFSRNGGVDTTNDAFMYMNATNCKGASSLRAQLYNNPVAPATDGGFILGYMTTPPNTNTTIIDPTKILYGIRFIDMVQPYAKIDNGAQTATAIMPFLSANPVANLRNDNIVIETFNGAIVGKVYNFNNPNGQELFNVQYDHTTELFPVLVFVSSFTQVWNIQFSSDPFYNSSNTLNDTVVDYDNITAVPIIRPLVRTNYFLYIVDIDIAQILGFPNNRLPLTGFVQPDLGGSLSFDASKMLSLRDISDAYIIELQNIKIDSYDSIKQQRMNILHVIPQFDIVKERLIYSTQYPLFLSLNNPFTLNLRQVKARLLKEDLSEVSTIGYSQMTILIDKN